MKLFRNVLCFTSFSIFAAACGGGDDSSNPIANPPLPPPVANYSVVELPRLPGHRGAQATDINDMGQIVGWSIGDTGPQTAVVWNIDPAGTVTVQSLGLLPGGTGSFATGINNLGQIVGFANSTLANRRPFIWTTSGGIRDLGVPTGFEAGQAHSINDNGQIVGAISIFALTDLMVTGRFAIWNVDQNGVLVDEQDLGTLGGQAATAWDNNVQGNVSGAIWFGGNNQTAFFWSMADGVIEINNTEEGLGINDNDEVVGIRSVNFGIQGFVWSRQGGMTGIPDALNSFSINNLRQVTGLADFENGQAYIWRAGQLQLLPMLENRDFSWGLAINESGWVVGWSTDRRGNEFANLWRPN